MKECATINPTLPQWEIWGESCHLSVSKLWFFCLWSVSAACVTWLRTIRRILWSWWIPWATPKTPPNSDTQWSLDTRTLSDRYNGAGFTFYLIRRWRNIWDVLLPILLKTGCAYSRKLKREELNECVFGLNAEGRNSSTCSATVKKVRVAHH